ncbi:AAA family ATPase (plasmid) [Rhizobium sp. 32-5/1]|uniref:ATP-dependent nuclease n=1 Tax=Rhizobium sp. 32-5/1 TaxID=3019602 RepID=UPI00240DED93|nr:AAA family ATPase [Rhizobium sp. 32-5/1]WEZ86299.1 AAA family ATPase [Rhizobium sp. 32-5/1]
MALIRVVEIENFRAIKALRWLPGPGINCLIGPGDSGKSTVLDAIDLCLGARRSLTFTDADFHGLNYDTPIRIAITLGALEAPLKTSIHTVNSWSALTRKAGPLRLSRVPGSRPHSLCDLPSKVTSSLSGRWCRHELPLRHEPAT